MGSADEDATSFPTDYEIAQSVHKKPIQDVVAPFGIEESDLDLQGEHIAKIKLDAINRLRNEGDGDNGNLILVTGMTPTPLGEGKTVTTVGLGQAFNHAGHDAFVAVREPSLGPVFGVKGGAAGGGYSQCFRWRD
jgi:Formate-tetrahydrofolate ligase (EC 6.3.4.3)